MLPSGRRIADPFLALLTLGAIAVMVFAVQTFQVQRDITKSEAATLPTFPGAQGFGSSTKGGRGGKVIEVTNLNESGPGSLKAAVESSGSRIVVFRVGGVIWLSDELSIKNPYITIAGQTAPGSGIVLRGAGIGVGTHDVIIRGMRIRPGDDTKGETTTTRDAMHISNSGSGQEVYNVMIDHNSFSWALDENTSVYNNGPGSRDITYSWNIISEALDNSIHIDEGKTTPGRHSMGTLLSSKSGVAAPKNISVHHNYYAHNNDRHPLSQATNVEFVNNLVYNWGSGPTKIDNETGTIINFNVIGNHYLSGKNTRGELPKSLPVWIDSSVSSGSKIYVKDNIGKGNSGGSGDDAWKNVYCEGSCRRSDSPGFTPTFSNTQASSAVKDLVLQYAGANTRRDQIDSLMVEDARNSTGTIIDCVTNCDSTDRKARRGWSVYSTNTSAPSDTDHDGMPDTWETARGLNPNSNDSARVAPSGYTFIEEYINSLIPMPSYLVPNPTSTPAPTGMPTLTPTGASSVTLTAVDDAYVTSLEPTVNRAANQWLIAETDSDSRRIIYLKFDLSTLAGKTITGARLRLHTKDDPSAGTAGAVNANLVASSSWNEETIVYNNRPTVSTTVLGTVTAPAINTTYTPTLFTSQIQSKAGSTVSMAIEGASDALFVDSKEVSTVSNRPALIVTYSNTSPTSTQTATSAPTAIPTATPTRVSTPVPSSALIPGDANGDSKVDLLDYVVWLGHFGQSTTNGPREGDFNRDSKVDLLDYVVWLANYS